MGKHLFDESVERDKLYKRRRIKEKRVSEGNMSMQSFAICGKLGKSTKKSGPQEGMRKGGKNIKKKLDEKLFSYPQLYGKKPLPGKEKRGNDC